MIRCFGWSARGKSGFTQTRSEEREGNFNGLFKRLSIFSFGNTPKPHGGGGVWKASCRVGPSAMGRELVMLCRSLHGTPPPRAWPDSSKQWSPGDAGSRGHAGLPSADTLHYRPSELSPPGSSKKPSVKGRYQTQCGSDEFSKILIFNCKLKVYHWQPILSVFLEMTGSLCSFLRNCLLSTHLKIACLLVTLLRKNGGFFLGGGLVQLVTQVHNPFSSWQTTYFISRRNALCTFPILPHGLLKRCVLKGRDLM